MEKLRLFYKDFSRYLQEVWIEVRPNKGRVVWPTYENVKISTKVVIVSSVFLGLFIGLMDHLFAAVLRFLVS